MNGRLSFNKDGKFIILQVSDAQDLQFARPAMKKMLDIAYDEVKPDLVLTYTIKPNIYGGLACRIEGHSSVDRAFGYKCYDTLDELQDTYQKLIEKSLLPLRQQGLSGAVYTQVSDVEEEVNGLMTYDRRILKLPNPIHL